MIEKIEKLASNIARGFSLDRYFSLRRKYYKSKVLIFKKIYAFRIKKMEAKQGGYVGLPEKEIFADQPIMPHGLLSVFIDERSFIGKNCIIHEQVVVGRSKGKSPTIGDGCFIGAGAKIIGGITIGENCRIGAGCVVVDDVPNDTTVVSQKPRYIHKDENYKINMDTQNEGVKNE